MNENTKTNNTNKIKFQMELEDTLWADFNIKVVDSHKAKGCCRSPADVIRRLIKNSILDAELGDVFKKYME